MLFIYVISAYVGLIINTRLSDSLSVSIEEGESLSKPVNSYVVLKCTVYGNSPIHITWIGPKGNTLSSDWYYIYTWTCTLALSPLNIIDNGYYTCRAQDQSGSTEEDVIQITAYECQPGTKFSYQSSTCEKCSAGKYNNQSGLSYCLECSAGTYSLSTGSTHCTPCEVGNFQELNGQTYCFSCPNGTTTRRPGASSKFDCIEVTLRVSINNEKPLSRPVSGDVTFTCSISGSGSISVYWNGPSGNILTSSSKYAVIPYNINTRQSTLIIYSLLTNDKGTYTCLARDESSSTAQDSIELIIYVKLSASINNEKPLSRPANSDVTLTCSISGSGSISVYWYGPSKDILTSGPRYAIIPYTVNTGQSSLIIYSLLRSDEGTYTCLARDESASTAHDSIDLFIYECSAGTFRSSRTSNCEECPVGTNQPNKNVETACLPCNGGTYQNQTGQSTCFQCIAGSYQPSTGSESCIKCNAGTYQPRTGSATQCFDCPLGTYQPSSGSVMCINCSVGTFQNRTGQTSCDTCTEGSFQPSVGTFECILCPRGMYQMHIGQTVCIECPSGSYKTEPGPGPCTACDLGTYQNLSGQMSCKECPKGRTTSGIGMKSIQECVLLENNLRTGADSKENNTNIGGIAGGAGGAIALLVMVVVVIFIAIRRHRLKETNSHKSSRQDDVLPPPSNRQPETRLQQQIREVVYTNLVLEEDSIEKYKIDASDEHASKDNTYYNMEENAILPRGAVMLSNLWDYVQENTLDGSKLSEEFEALPSGLLSPAKAALKPSNCQKNRYKGLYPYDSTRVKLLRLGEDKSDYINASFINGYFRPKAYIASQGTTKSNINDFWRMIYQQDVEQIVMLTRLAEGDTIKCLQYWPNEGSQQQYGGIKVTLVHVDAFAEYDIRTLTMTVENTTKQVTQFHFTAWPDKGVPAAASSIVQFWHKVRNAQPHKQSPTVVHCSAGIGRTGTYIALDYLVDQGKDKQYVNIFPCVAQLRGQRVNLVQTEAQYRFLHEALVEALMVSGSAVSAEKFPCVYRELLEIDRKQRKTGLLIEFEKLQNESNKAAYHAPRDNDTDDEEEESESKKETTTNNPQRTSRLEINKHKNRYSNILPADEYRPCLSLVEGRTDYINAVKLQSHRQKDGLIVTQMPIEDTVIDFWRLVYDFGVRTIVMLNVLPMNKDSIGVYWPSKGESMTEAFFNIETVDESTDNTDYLWRTIRLTKGGEQPREVRQFQCKFWPGSEKVPLETEAMLKLIDGVEQWQRQADIKTVVIHCMDGAERSGLYCVLTTVLERLNVERDVAIYQTVKKMRTRRQQIIPNFEQYKYCHDVVLEYLSNFGTYSNFSEI